MPAPANCSNCRAILPGRNLGRHTPHALCPSRNPAKKSSIPECRGTGIINLLEYSEERLEKRHSNRHCRIHFAFLSPCALVQLFVDDKHIGSLRRTRSGAIIFADSQSREGGVSIPGTHSRDGNGPGTRTHPCIHMQGRHPLVKPRHPLRLRGSRGAEQALTSKPLAR